MPVRALLIVNPRATSTAAHDPDVIAGSLAARVDLQTVYTRYRGHAGDLAAALAGRPQDGGPEVLLTYGGDGTVNEVVNGLMRGALAPGACEAQGTQRAPGAQGIRDAGLATKARGPSVPAAGKLPAVAPIPGGNANVFARSLGLPADPLAAVEAILACLSAGRTRTIGLGMAQDRYFTFSAGLGLDAEVVRAVEELRASGRRASPSLFFWATLRQYFGVTDRRHPALTLERDGRPPIAGLFMGIVSNTTPWTYLGSRPISPTPNADFNSGLDVFALRELRTLSTLNAVRQMMRRGGGPPSGRCVVSLHDEAELTLRSRRPIAFQVDGEYVGEPESVTFRFVPQALRVAA